MWSGSWIVRGCIVVEELAVACAGICTVWACTGVTKFEGCAPDDALLSLLLPLVAEIATVSRVSPGGRFREHAHLRSGMRHFSQICSIAIPAALSVFFESLSSRPSTSMLRSSPLRSSKSAMAARATHRKKPKNYGGGAYQRPPLRLIWVPWTEMALEP